MNLLPLVKPQFLDENGNPVAGGKVYFYQAGTSTPLATYADKDGVTPNSNPVVLDSGGFADVWISAANYKVVLKTSADVPIWTKDYVGIGSGGFTTGDVKTTFKSSADTGWVMMNDTSIGSAASSATGRANADTADLFALLWNNVSDTYAPVSGGRGVSASADFAANKTLTLPKSLGRVLGGAGAGSGLTSRSLGQSLGEESHVLTEAELASHTHMQDPHTHLQDAHSHRLAVYNGANGNSSLAGALGFAYQDSAGNGNGTTAANNTLGPSNDPTVAVNQNATATNQATGSGTAHNTMQPTLFLNIMVKL